MPKFGALVVFVSHDLHSCIKNVSALDCGMTRKKFGLKMLYDCLFKRKSEKHNWVENYINFICVLEV